MVFSHRLVGLGNDHAPKALKRPFWGIWGLEKPCISGCAWLRGGTRQQGMAAHVIRFVDLE